MKTKKTYFNFIQNSILLAFVLFFTKAYTQTNVPYFGKINCLSGFNKELSGENITYFSIYPDNANKALLTRATDGNKTIAWETISVPKTWKDNYIYFNWIAAHSTGSSSGERNFDLYVNDEKVLTFTTKPANKQANWIFTAPDSTALVFQQIKRDGAGDSHGLAYLRLPKTRIKAGQAVKLKVIGQAQNSNDWYMTFKFPFEEKVDVNIMPFLLKNGKQVISLTALHFGKEQQLNIKINNKERYSFIMKKGINNFDIPVNAVTKKDSVQILAYSTHKTFMNKFVTLLPVVYREFHFVHHSHTDIGYSHLQPDVLKIHLKNINDALLMIEKTKNYPKEARFKWNIESLWTVDHYMKTATESQKKQFIEAVKTGDICLSALYANILTGLSQPEEMFHYTDYAKKLSKEYDLTIPSAMISDVPGFAWSTVTALAKGGVKYFSSGPNFSGNNHPYLGDRVGNFVRYWGDKPVWWASPSGEEKVLFWTGGKGYSSWHETAVGGIFNRGTKKIASYLDELTENKYPYELVQWRYNILGDNAPIDTSISDFIKQWNEKYSSPKIVLSTTDNLFQAFELKYGNQIPTVKGDITPYWEDGALSSADEEGKNRQNSLRLQQLTTLYSMLNPQKFDTQKFEDAWTNILMFHEHTWGAHNSTTEPDVPFVTEQWRIKKQFMLDAEAQIKSLEDALLKPISNLNAKKIAVFNTCSWPRTEPVILSGNFNGKSIKDSNGNKFPLQKMSNGNYVFIANKIPALATAMYEISDENITTENNFTLQKNSLSNGILTLNWDANSGSIVRLTSKNDFNYAGDFNNQGLNSFWYIPGLDPANALTNEPIQIKIIDKGPILTSIAFISEAPGTNQLERIVSLYAGSDILLIENKIDKKAVRDKEAMHFAFPFNSVLTTSILDAGYGTMNYLTDQLIGSNMDFLYARRWLDVFGLNKGIQLMFIETPLLEAKEMIDERKIVSPSHKKWKTEGQPTSKWFSYAMNNYWHTNYKADQSGNVSFKYALRPHQDINYLELEKATNTFTQPLIAIPVMNDLKTESLFELTNNRIIVTSVTPNENGTFLIRLFNPEPSTQETQLILKSTKEKATKHLQDIKMNAMSVFELTLKK